MECAQSFSATLSEIAEMSCSAPGKSPRDLGSRRVAVKELFNVQMGTNLELLRLTKDPSGINFVSRTARNNGVTSRVASVPGLLPTPAGAISVAGGGSVLESFAQFDPFYSGRDLFVLHPKSTMCAEELMFYAACIRANQSRYSYGRQANRTLKDLQIPARDAVPQWIFGSLARVAERLRGNLHI